jgi:uncharacterized protein (DUF4415 family)
MSASNMNKSSETDWERVDAQTDDLIDTSDIPGLSDDFFARATLRMPRQFTTVTLQVDSEVWAWFEAQGEECNPRLNAALRIYAEAHKVHSIS